MITDKLLTTKEVAAKLRLHRNTVARLLAAGKFPGAFRVGQQWRIPAADVLAFSGASETTNGSGQS